MYVHVGSHGVWRTGTLHRYTSSTNSPLGSHLYMYVECIYIMYDYARQVWMSVSVPLLNAACVSE